MKSSWLNVAELSWVQDARNGPPIEMPQPITYSTEDWNLNKFQVSEENSYTVYYYWSNCGDHRPSGLKLLHLPILWLLLLQTTSRHGSQKLLLFVVQQWRARCQVCNGWTCQQVQRSSRALEDIKTEALSTLFSTYILWPISFCLQSPA